MLPHFLLLITCERSHQLVWTQRLLIMTSCLAHTGHRLTGRIDLYALRTKTIICVLGKFKFYFEESARTFCDWIVLCKVLMLLRFLLSGSKTHICSFLRNKLSSPLHCCLLAPDYSLTHMQCSVCKWKSSVNINHVVWNCISKYSPDVSWEVCGKVHYVVALPVNTQNMIDCEIVGHLCMYQLCFCTFVWNLNVFVFVRERETSGNVRVLRSTLFWKALLFRWECMQVFLSAVFGKCGHNVENENRW